jgi:hypothetical protein
MPTYDIKGHQFIIDEDDKDLVGLKWSVNNGYAVRTAKPKQMHRIILERKIERSLEKDEICDHVDGNRLNNSRSNLRVATQAQNIWNSKVNAASRTGYKGVYVASLGQTWDVVIGVKGESIKLGRFTDIREAIKAYNDAAIEHYGEFARLNSIPDEDPYQELKTLTDEQIRDLKHMGGGGISIHTNHSDAIDEKKVLVDMGLAECHIEARVEHYARYTLTEAGRKLLYPLHPEKREK